MEAKLVAKEREPKEARMTARQGGDFMARVQVWDFVDPQRYRKRFRGDAKRDSPGPHPRGKRRDGFLCQPLSQAPCAKRAGLNAAFQGVILDDDDRGSAFEGQIYGYRNH